MAIAIFGPLVNIPQIIKIFTEKSAAGISLVTWSLYIVISIPWILYGIAHKEPPIIISYILLIILHSIVIAGIFMYG